MSKCENCVHEDVCRIKTYCDRCGLTTSICNDYKDKSLFVELTCKVGTKIYYIFQYSDKRLLPFVREAKVKTIRCSNNKNDFLFDCECGTKKQTEKVIRTWLFTDFGKTVFLTKEEAEAKLKELGV